MIDWTKKKKKKRPDKIICKNTRIIIITQFPFQRKPSC